MTRYKPPYPPYGPKDPKGFSVDTAIRGWPTILTSITGDILDKQEKIRKDGRLSEEEQTAAITEGTEIIAQVNEMRTNMSRDQAMSKIEQDDGPNVDNFNLQLEDLRENTPWFKAPWLYAECYMYRLLRTFFARSQYWRQHDPFLEQKNKAFRSSGKAIHKLAATLVGLDGKKEDLMDDESALKTLFGELLHRCLWGNTKDLSLLTTMSHADIQKLQTISKDEQAQRAQYILLDQGEAAWNQLRESHDRVDIVLDNAGFELYTDLIFAEFLVSFMDVRKVIFHPKSIPWFVSDVTNSDFALTIQLLQRPEQWANSRDQQDDPTALQTIAKRFQERLDTGVFELSVPLTTKLGEVVLGTEYEFWTNPSAYFYIHEEAPGLLQHLRASSLVIFKGDLNYRKLTGDVKWPVSTPFHEALGPIRGEFPILSLRINKSDVAVGVAEEVATELEDQNIVWRTNGKYALISYEAGSRKR